MPGCFLSGLLVVSLARGDQAEGLRRIFGPRPLQIIALVAATVGEGKSQVIFNLGAALAASGRHVLILDESASPCDLISQLGLHGRSDLLDVICHGELLEKAIFRPAAGLAVLGVSNLVTALGALTQPQQDRLVTVLTGLDPSPDVILIDAVPDAAWRLSPLALLAHDTVVVLSATTHSVKGAYQLIKKVSQDQSRRSFRLLLNRGKQANEAEKILCNMNQLALSRMGVRVDYGGFIPFDESVRQAQALFQPVTLAFPQSPAARSFVQLVQDIFTWPQESFEIPAIEGFIRQSCALSQRWCRGFAGEAVRGMAHV